MKSAGTVLTAVFLVAALLLTMPVPLLYVQLAGSIAQGHVVSKREFFETGDNDRWTHRFEVTYQYQPPDSRLPLTASHAVDEGLFRRLHAGSQVTVRYSPWPPLRYMKAVGSSLAGSSVRSRFPIGSDSLRSWLEIVAGIGTIALAALAYRRKTRALILAAVFAGAVMLSGVLLFGFLVFPILFYLWRKHAGYGYGPVFVSAMAVSAAVLYVRMPPVTPMPGGETRRATAVVRKITKVDRIWGDAESSGQPIPQPYQMVDLEFQPASAVEAIHVLDQVDEGSVAGLSVGSTVEIEYSGSNPALARIAGGSRSYREKALTYILKLTYGIAALIVLVAFPLVWIFEVLRRRVEAVQSKVSPTAIEKMIARMDELPPDDPRRRTLETLLKKDQR